MPSYIEGLNQNGAVVQSLRWQDFKALFQAKLLSLDYVTATDSYTVYAQDGQTTYSCFLVFTSASANYPFPYPDGYTQTQNDTDVTDFTTNFQSTSNIYTHFSYGAIGQPIPLAANLTGGLDVNGHMQAVGLTLTGAAATAAQQGLVVSVSPNSIAKVTGTGTAGTPAAGVVTIQGISGGFPIPISGSITATNPSVGLNGAPFPTSSTQIGASDGTDLQQLLVESATFWNLRTSIYFGATEATVKAASTPAASTDTSLVVALNPNTPLPAGSNALGSVTVTGTVAVTQSTSPWITKDQSDGAVSNGAPGSFSMLSGLIYTTAAPTLTTGNQNALRGDVNGNLFVNLATPLPAGSNNIGSVNQGTSPWVTSVTGTVAVTQSTSPWIVAGGGTAGTPATGVVTIQGITGGTVVPTKDAADGATGSPVPATATQIAGPDAGGNLTAPGITDASTAATAAQTAMVVALSPNSPVPAGTNTIGAVAPVDGFKASYAASVHGLTVAATPTDIWTMSGSATKVIRITRISISGNASSGGNVLFRVIKRSTADTAGTSTTLTDVPNDSGDAAGTSVVKAYTVNPTALGTAVGDVADWTLYITGTGNTNQEPFQNTWGSMAGSKALVLRGVAQFLCINLNGVTMGGSSLNIVVEWTEE